MKLYLQTQPEELVSAIQSYSLTKVQNCFGKMPKQGTSINKHFQYPLDKHNAFLFANELNKKQSEMGAYLVVRKLKAIIAFLKEQGGDFPNNNKEVLMMFEAIDDLAPERMKILIKRGKERMEAYKKLYDNDYVAFNPDIPHPTNNITPLAYACLYYNKYHNIEWKAKGVDKVIQVLLDAGANWTYPIDPTFHKIVNGKQITFYGKRKTICEVCKHLSPAFLNKRNQTNDNFTSNQGRLFNFVPLVEVDKQPVAV